MIVFASQKDIRGSTAADSVVVRNIQENIQGGIREEETLEADDQCWIDFILKHYSNLKKLYIKCRSFVFP